MLRASFFAAGLFVGLMGVSCLFTDRVILTVKQEEQTQPSQDIRGLFTTVNSERQKVIDPPEWAAFSLMSVGAVTMLYAVALPKKS